ncbi:MAG: hypothetical protein ACI9R3_000686 [Verrucomicrobiales bacterium]|jgi:hypothetical protein
MNIFTKLAAVAIVGYFIVGTIQAETITAADLLQRIDGEKPVRIASATITGDLDFTRLKRKTRGGSYGGRVGQVKEFFTKLKAPLLLEDCVIEGGIITFREERKRLLLKEYFVAFDAPLTLRRCQVRGAVDFERLTFYGNVVIEDCVFDEKVRFEKVHFSKPPTILRNGFKKGLIDRETNLKEKPKTERRVAAKKEQPAAAFDIPVVLKNPSRRAVAIQFGKEKWTLSPKGTSTLQAASGTKIFLIKKGKKDRVLLTVTPEIAGETFDVTRL